MPKAAVSFFFLLMLVSLPGYAQLSLDLLEKVMQSKFPILHLTWQALKQEIVSVDSSRYLLFDTRAPAEYQTSHIRSAIQVDPQMPAADFIKIYGDTLKDKHVVFYCSVGYRSSIFALRVEAGALKAGARSVANLRGGIFRWYNEANPVVDVEGETDQIHPYDSFWGVLIRERKKDETKDSMSPKQKHSE
ncbi:MAG: rhodanese-like domain-containing protein [bacterium]